MSTSIAVVNSAVAGAARVMGFDRTTVADGTAIVLAVGLAAVIALGKALYQEALYRATTST